MKIRLLAVAAALAAGVGAGPVLAQQPPQGPQPYSVGNPLGVPGRDGAFAPISSNVKVFGAIFSAESCSYDAERGVTAAPARRR